MAVYESKTKLEKIHILKRALSKPVLNIDYSGWMVSCLFTWGWGCIHTPSLISYCGLRPNIKFVLFFLLSKQYWYSWWLGNKKHWSSIWIKITLACNIGRTRSLQSNHLFQLYFHGNLCAFFFSLIDFMVLSFNSTIVSLLLQPSSWLPFPLSHFSASLGGPFFSDLQFLQVNQPRAEQKVH